MTLRDLTHPIEDGMLVYPGDPEVRVDPAADFERDGYRVTELSLGTHVGTHVDAPSHLERDGRTLSDYDVESFRWDARVVHLDPGEREAIPADAVPDVDADAVVFATGWSDHWNTETYRDHPSLAPDAAARCAERGYHVGVDLPSVDPPESEAFPSHHELLDDGRLIVENLRNLDGLPERVTLHAHPLRVDVDGAPVRALAEYDAR